MTWLATAWAKISLGAKLAVVALLGVVGYIGYIRLKRAGAEREADRLRGQLAIKAAEARVAYLEGQKVRNAARLAEIPAERAALDEQIKQERKRVVEVQKRINNLSDEQLAARFRELGY